MRPSQKNNRPRNKGGRKAPGLSVNRVYDSSGPEGKVRGTPQQIIEKYQALARDKATAGDRVMAENFLQHAEHYVRILTAAQAAAAPARREEPREHEGRDEFDGAGAVGREGGEAEADGVADGMMVMGGDDAAGSELVSADEADGQPSRGRAPGEAADDEAAADAPRRRSTRRATRRPRGDEAGLEASDEEAAPRRRGRRPAAPRDEEAEAPSEAQGGMNGSSEGGDDRAANGAGGDWDHDEIPHTVN